MNNQGLIYVVKASEVTRDHYFTLNNGETWGDLNNDDDRLLALGPSSLVMVQDKPSSGGVLGVAMEDIKAGDRVSADPKTGTLRRWRSNEETSPEPEPKPYRAKGWPEISFGPGRRLRIPVVQDERGVLLKGHLQIELLDDSIVEARFIDG